MAAERKPAADTQAPEIAPAPEAAELLPGPDLRVIVRQEVQAALAGFADDLRASIASASEGLKADMPSVLHGALMAASERIGQQIHDEPEPVELQARTIRHDMFTYDLPNGGQAIARRGDTVDLLPRDIERGERFQAFTAKPGVLPEPQGSTLPAFPLDGSETEHDAWVGSGSVQEIVTAVNARPEILTAVLAAEQRRGSGGRVTLLDSLARLRTA